MTVYKPIHTGKWEIWELDTDNLKRIGSGHTVTDYKKAEDITALVTPTSFLRTVNQRKNG